MIFSGLFSNCGRRNDLKPTRGSGSDEDAMSEVGGRLLGFCISYLQSDSKMENRPREFRELSLSVVVRQNRSKFGVVFDSRHRM
jgi:hypothetical protein